MGIVGEDYCPLHDTDTVSGTWVSFTVPLYIELVASPVNPWILLLNFHSPHRTRSKEVASWTASEEIITFQWYYDEYTYTNPRVPIQVTWYTLVCSFWNRVWLEPSLSWKSHLERAIEKGELAFRSLAQILASTWGPPVRKSRVLYSAIVRQIMTYRAQIWAVRADNSTIASFKRHKLKLTLKDA